MEATTEFTAQDVIDFAEIIRPHLVRAADCRTLEDQMVAAAYMAQQHSERRYADALGSEGTPGGLFEHLIAALSSTYDEFRAEAGI